MKYMIDTRKIPKGRPSEEQIAKNMWQTQELVKMGLTVPYDSGRTIRKNKKNSKGSSEIKLTQFKSHEEHAEAMLMAMELLDKFEPVPEPMRTKLILEAENYRKHGRLSCLS